MSRKIRLKRSATNFPGKHPRKKQCAPNTNLFRTGLCGEKDRDGQMTFLRKLFGF